jgi:UDP-glucose 6-dehydrogenase
MTRATTTFQQKTENVNDEERAIVLRATVVIATEQRVHHELRSMLQAKGSPT